MASKFRPTHEITLTDSRDGERKTIPVRLVDGAGYTREEWDADDKADWEWSADRGWTFQGQDNVPRHSISVRALSKRVPEGSQYASPPRGPGRPRTTGSGSTPRITFAAPSPEAFARLKAEADALNLSVGQLAKLRTFAHS